MKKQYKKPESKVVKLDSSSIICVSAGFGDGVTYDMHAKRHYLFEDDEDELCDE